MELKDTCKVEDVLVKVEAIHNYQPHPESQIDMMLGIQRIKQTIRKPLCKRMRNKRREILRRRILYLYDNMLSDSLSQLYKTLGQSFDPLKHLSYKQNFTCVYCSKIFSSSCSLGGHISRSHKEEITMKKIHLKENQLRFLCGDIE